MRILPSRAGTIQSELRSVSRAPTVLIVLLALVGCGGQPPPTVVVPVTPAQTVVVLPTATGLATTVAPTTMPTPMPLFVSAYHHRTGVFGMNTLENWELLDNSNEQRIYVRMMPPMGYGSRMMIDITNEGALNPDEVRQLAESYVRLNYSETPGYSEVGRSDLADGRLQFIFLYDDRRGATGRETLTIQQTGPFFVAMRVFVSDRDTASLGQALEQVASSFIVDPLAAWGTQVAAINPAELQITNTFMWQDGDDSTHYMGEIINSSPADITSAEVMISFCDEAGVVIAEVRQPVDVHLIPRSGAAAFEVVSDRIPNDASVCRKQASARPASPDPSYTTAATFEAAVSYHQWRRDLTVEGPITNYGLAPLSRIEVIIIAYNANNQVVGYAKVPLDASLKLDPGQTYAFETVIPELGAAPHHIATMVQAQIASQSNPSLAPTTAPLPTP